MVDALSRVLLSLSPVVGEPCSAMSIIVGNKILNCLLGIVASAGYQFSVVPRSKLAPMLDVRFFANSSVFMNTARVAQRAKTDAREIFGMEHCLII